MPALTPTLTAELALEMALLSPLEVGRAAIRLEALAMTLRIHTPPAHRRETLLSIAAIALSAIDRGPAR